MQPSLYLQPVVQIMGTKHFVDLDLSGLCDVIDHVTIHFLFDTADRLSVKYAPFSHNT